MNIIYSILVCILMFGHCYGTHNFDPDIHHEIQKFHLRGIPNSKHVYCSTEHEYEHKQYTIGCEPNTRLS